jgi:hypothetical protein
MRFTAYVSSRRNFSALRLGVFALKVFRMDAPNDFASIIYNDRGGTHDGTPFGETIMPEANQTTEEIKLWPKKQRNPHRRSPHRNVPKQARPKRKSNCGQCLS